MIATIFFSVEVSNLAKQRLRPSTPERKLVKCVLQVSRSITDCDGLVLDSYRLTADIVSTMRALEISINKFCNVYFGQASQSISGLVGVPVLGGSTLFAVYSGCPQRVFFKYGSMD